MGRYQVKCRRCRLWLFSEEAVVDSHGDPVQGELSDWDCGSQGGAASTQLFVSTDHGPPWIMELIAESGYTQGKILCPKCQGRLGSFDFVRSTRTCSCGQNLQPPAHLVRDRLDIVDSHQQHTVTTPRTTGWLTMPSTYIANPQRTATGMEHSQDSISAHHDDAWSWDLQWLFGESQHTDNETPVHGIDSCEEESMQCRTCTASGLATEVDSGDEDSGVCVSVGERHRTRAGPRNNVRQLVREARRAGLRSCGKMRNSAKRKERAGNEGRRGYEEDGEGEDVSRAWEEIFPSQASDTTPTLRRHLPVFHLDREREKLERERMEQQQLQTEDVLWEHTCPMCLEVMWRPHTTLPCRHHFCEGCLRRLTTISSSSKSDCPLCRQRIAKCTHDEELEQLISTKYPTHIKVQRREVKRRQQRTRHMPLPGLPFPHSYLAQLPRPSPRLSPTSTRRLALLVCNVVVVVALAYVGMGICQHVLGELAGVFDGVMVRLTGERLWSQFLGVESRVVSVSCVFVLYLICACMVHYLPLFHQLHN